ncbi:hypothetical protein BJ912DRAFT_26178 [Pholiota molesta]|nr:hypothetical protein BJ912DRAFT_26178 [Pholiota molesta]
MPSLALAMLARLCRRPIASCIPGVNVSFVAWPLGFVLRSVCDSNQPPAPTTVPGKYAWRVRYLPLLVFIRAPCS